MVTFKKIGKRCVVLGLLLAMMALAVAPCYAEETETLDVDRLIELMTQASVLTQEEYTSASWNTLQTAVSVGQESLMAQDQYLVDAAVSLLDNALNNLQTRQYEDLEEALAAMETWTEDPDFSELWQRLVMLYEAADDAKESSDQEAVDAVAEQIQDTLDQMEAKSDATRKVIPWAICLLLSLLVNFGFVALVIIRTRNTRRYQKDDVPLVEYDIDDDIL